MKNKLAFVIKVVLDFELFSHPGTLALSSEMAKRKSTRTSTCCSSTSDSFKEKKDEKVLAVDLELNDRV